MGEVQISIDPTNAKLNVKLKHVARYLINISDINGKVLYTRGITGPTDQIDLSSFQNGVYLIIIETDDFVTTRKIIKQ